MDQQALAAQLARAGFVAPEEEADELIACAGRDTQRLRSLIERRLTGEPLAWITGRVTFCGLEIGIDSGVYVPRWQSQRLARRAIAALPPDGIAIDLCTGSGAIAKALASERPEARVVATDMDARAVACATANGVETYQGDLFVPLPPELQGHVDVIVAVVPYVPTTALPLLQRDTLVFESALSYDGGENGTVILRRVLKQAPRFLRPGGVIFLELGGPQADMLGMDVEELGYTDVAVITDEDNDVRGLAARWPSDTDP
jgi:release factor glutamine methyltransferase